MPAKAGIPAGERRRRSSPAGAPACAGATWIALAVAGLLGLPLAALAAAPSGPPATQNEQGHCVSAGVQNRFRESGTAEALARQIVAACIPERRSSSAAGNSRHKAYFDRRYADERDGAVRCGAVRCG